MPFVETSLKGLLVFTPTVFEDERGYFFESYNKQKFMEAGINCEFVQDNQSLSCKGTIRGIHLQTGDFAQAKLVRVLEGEVLDVAVDLRLGSETYGKCFSLILTAENRKQLFIPKGFGHGFSVLSETAVFSYKCDNFYNKQSETGIVFDDPDLRIDWKVEKEIVSEKDLVLGSFKQFSSSTGAR